MLLAACLNNDAELGFEGGTSNEEAINVWLCDELCNVTCVSRAAILNSSGSGHLSVHVLGEP